MNFLLQLLLPQPTQSSNKLLKHFFSDCFWIKCTHSTNIRRCLKADVIHINIIGIKYITEAILSHMIWKIISSTRKQPERFEADKLLYIELDGTYLRAALSQASGVSTAGKLSVVKSILSKSSFNDVGCIFTRSINVQKPLGALGWLSEQIYCSNWWSDCSDCWYCGFFPLSRRTIVNPLSSEKQAKPIKFRFS